MSSVTVINHRINNAINFKEQSSEPTPNTKLLIAIGRSAPWPGNPSNPDMDSDTNPPAANASIATQYEVWRNMISAKQITEYDIRHVIPRYNWRANTRYIAYDDHARDLYDFDNQFYVMTSDYNVYKCLANNSNSVSTIEPSSVNPEIVTQTGDGYIWKYMYTISDADQLRFVTEDYIPVKTLLTDDGSLQWKVQENAEEGSIYSVVLSSGGSNYSNTNNITVTISGDGSGATATATLNTISNTVNSIIMSAYGSDYTRAVVTITGGGGSGANARAIISPPGGHGSDPLHELGGAFLLLNPRLYNSENQVLTIENQFRQIVILKDPYLFGTNTVVSNSTFSQTMDITVSGSGASYTQDEIVYQGSSLTTATFRGEVVEFDISNNIVKLINTEGEPSSDALVGSSSFASKFISSINYPDLEPNSGKILYIDDIMPIARASNQTEDFKILIKF